MGGEGRKYWSEQIGAEVAADDLERLFLVTRTDTAVSGV